MSLKNSDAFAFAQTIWKPGNKTMDERCSPAIKQQSKNKNKFKI